MSQAPAYQALLDERNQRWDWLFVGCGTSFYLAEAAASAWTTLSGRRSRALPASEVLLFADLAKPDPEKTQAVIISRSGRTSEAVRAAELLNRSFKVPTLRLTCTADSKLARTCERTLALPGADEQSLVMTRSFSSMFLALLHLGAARASKANISFAIENASA